MDFAKMTLKYPKIHKQIHKWILEAEEKGWKEVEIVIKTHAYKLQWIDLKAIKPKKDAIAKSMSERIKVERKKK